MLEKNPKRAGPKIRRGYKAYRITLLLTPLEQKAVVYPAIVVYVLPRTNARGSSEHGFFHGHLTLPNNGHLFAVIRCGTTKYDQAVHLRGVF